MPRRIFREAPNEPTDEQIYGGPSSDTRDREVAQDQHTLASEKQLNFIRTLATEREIDEAARVSILERVESGQITKSRASDFIARLLDKPKIVAQGQSPRVPAGRYAIDQEGTVKFYKVNTPTEGRWAGFTFVDVQASDEFHPIRSRATKDQILAIIAQDPKGALLRYGQLIGHCGHCGRTLTDETSRELGIGPICRENLGW